MEPDATVLEPVKIKFESAAGHASRDVPVFGQGEYVESVRESIAGRRFETAVLVIVCEDGKLVGVVRIEDLLAADSTEKLADVMDREAPFVAPGIDQEVAAMRAANRGESALPVVDGNGNFVGVIPPHRLLAVL